MYGDRDRTYISLEGCLIFLALVIIIVVLIVYLSVYTIIALFVGSCAVTFIAGIVVMLLQINALPDVVPANQDKFFRVSSFELFKLKNRKLLYDCACEVAKNTAIIMCHGKKMRNEDIFVLDQKKAPRETTLGCFFSIFKYSALAGFYLVRLLFGIPRDVMNDNGGNGPLDSDFARGTIITVGLTYVVLFAVASVRFILDLSFLLVFCVFHFIFIWSRKVTHDDHSFFHPAYRCIACGSIHSSVGPSIMGAGVIFQTCAGCGVKYCAAFPRASKKLIPVCPVCLEELRRNRIQQ